MAKILDPIYPEIQQLERLDKLSAKTRGAKISIYTRGD